MAEPPLTIEEITALGEGTTPGPWAFDGFAAVFPKDDTDPNLRLMAHLHGTAMEADGALIAAAPALREAALYYAREAAMADDELGANIKTLVRQRVRVEAERDAARSEVTVMQGIIDHYRSGCYAHDGWWWQDRDYPATAHRIEPMTDEQAAWFTEREAKDG